MGINADELNKNVQNPDSLEKRLFKMEAPYKGAIQDHKEIVMGKKNRAAMANSSKRNPFQNNSILPMVKVKDTIEPIMK